MRDLVIVKLLDAAPGRKIQGKKAFQKLVYFLQHRGVPLGFRYVMHFYGPYSFDLANYARAMEMSALLTMADAGLGVNIELGPSGRNLLRQNVPTGYEEDVRFVTEKLASRSSRELELLATTHFLVHNAQQELIRMRDLVDWVNEEKQGKFTKAQIVDAARQLVDLGLLSTARPISTQEGRGSHRSSC